MKNFCMFCCFNRSSWGSHMFRSNCCWSELKKIIIKMFRKWRMLGQLYLRNVTWCRKCLGERGGLTKMHWGWKTAWHQSLSHNIQIKLSVRMVYVLSTPHAYKRWPNLKRTKPFFFFFLKAFFASFFTCFLENRNYLQMFSPGWRWFIVALLWRSWTDFCCGIKKKKKKSQIIIQFHFRTVSKLINDIFSLDALRVLETVL